MYSDGTGTTPLAAGLDLTQPLPEQLKGAIQQTLVFNYDQFLQIVAGGRNIQKSRVAELAQGRVYDGKTARDLGLVDKLGSLDDAIQSAALLADLSDFDTEYIRRPISVKEHFLRFLTTKLSVFGSNLETDRRVVAQLKDKLLNNMDKFLLFDDPHNIYAHCLINLSL